MADINLNADEIFVLANASPQVQAAIQKKAAGSARRARQELKRAGIEAEVSIRKRPLATGRASYDVVAVPKDPEDERRVGRIMRRSVRGGR